MLQAFFREFFQDEEQSRYLNLFTDLQNQIFLLRTEKAEFEYKKETERLREALIEKILSLTSTIDAQKVELKEQRQMIQSLLKQQTHIIELLDVHPEVIVHNSY